MSENILKKRLLEILENRLASLLEMRKTFGHIFAPPNLEYEIEAIESYVNQLRRETDNRPERNHVTLISNKQGVTPETIAEDVAPYLQAMTDLQHIINELQKRPSTEIRVNWITIRDVDAARDIETISFPGGVVNVSVPKSGEGTDEIIDVTEADDDDRGFSGHHRYE
jgi:hypothetical protein